MTSKRKRSNIVSTYSPEDELLSSPTPSPTTRKKQKTQQNQLLTDQDLDTNYSNKTLPFKNPFYERAGGNKKQKKTAAKSLKQMIALENYDQLPAEVATYLNIEAPPSMLPAKKYSDISGYSAKYTDPHTGLRFSTVEEYRKIKTLSEDIVQQYLLVRKASRAIV